MLLTQYKVIKFLVVSGLLKLFIDKKEAIVQVWQAKYQNFVEKNEELVQSLSLNDHSDTEHGRGTRFNGLLKLNIILDIFVNRSQKVPDEIISKLSEVKNILGGVTYLDTKEHLYFYVVYLILELQAISQENTAVRLAIKNALSTFENDLKVSPDVVGYFTALFRLDELLVPRDESDPEALKIKISGIIHHSLK
jgi:hypothetical protein